MPQRGYSKGVFAKKTELRRERRLDSVDPVLLVLDPFDVAQDRRQIQVRGGDLMIPGDP